MGRVGVDKTVMTGSLKKSLFVSSHFRKTLR